jgi:hypothetical protein
MNRTTLAIAVIPITGMSAGEVRSNERAISRLGALHSLRVVEHREQSEREDLQIQAE